MRGVPNRGLSPQPRWMRDLAAGDVLTNGGRWRVLRHVTYHNGPRAGRLAYVTFVIRHCSWTGRCYTVMTASDLRSLGYRKVRVKRRRLAARIDRMIVSAFTNHDDRRLSCCDVEEIQ